MSTRSAVASRNGKHRRLQFLAALLALVIGLTATAVIGKIAADQEHSQAQAAAAENANDLARRVGTTLGALNDSADVVHAFVFSVPDGVETKEVDAFLDVVHSQWPELRTISVAPANTVAAIAPLKGNEAVVGLHYADKPQMWPAVEAAMLTRKPQLDGPIDFVQGGRGFVYRVPVFAADGVYWGMVSSAIDFTQLAPSDSPDGFAVRSGNGPKRVLVGSPTTFEDAQIATVESLNEKWEVAVPIPPAGRSTIVAISAFGTLASVVLASLVFLLVGSASRGRASARLMNDLSAQAPGVLFELWQKPDGSREFVFTSASFTEEVQREGGPGANPLAVLRDHAHPDDAQSLTSAFDESARTGRPVRHQFRVVTSAKGTQWIRVEAQPQTLRGGGIVWHGWASDISELLRDQDALRISASVFETTRDGIAVLDSDGRITEVNPGMEAITGRSRDQLLGRLLSDFCQTTTTTEGLKELQETLNRDGFWRGEVATKRADGSRRTDAAHTIAVHKADGSLSHYLVTLDNTNLTRDDHVTGLPNVRTFDDEVAAAEAEARDAGLPTALVVVGLDRFHHVNDTYGHRVGDRLLRIVADRLRAVIPLASPLTRLRGDEFAFAVSHVRTLSNLEEHAKEVLDAIAMPIDVGTATIRCTATAGISMSPDDATDVLELRRNADQAMRAAKSDGPGLVRFFDDNVSREIQEQAMLLEDLQAAIGTDQLTMVFQPIVDLRTNKTSHIETLMRWTHPTRGPISPEVFIPLAERSGLVADLSDLAFARATEALTVLRLSQPELRASVNLSPAEFRDGTDRHLRRVDRIRSAGLPADSIIVEITEGVLVVDDETAQSCLDVYRSAGMGFAIDDFGTGYSSLAYLQHLDVDYLKIDRRFVQAMDPANDGLALVQAIIEMAHRMGIRVIAEGVETVEQDRLLSEAACDYVQGYLHSRPLELAALQAMLEEFNEINQLVDNVSVVV